MTSRNTPGNHPGKKPSKSQMQKQQAAKRAMAAASGAKAARRKRLLQVLVPVVTVIVVVGILIGVKVSTDNNAKPNTASAASRAVTNAVTHVPASVFDKVGASAKEVAGATKQLTGPPLTENGKPKVLYVGADWCPYCAAERWALAAAVSRFGTLTDLGETASSPTDVDPNTPTLSFHGAKYSSDHITLAAKELENGARQPLDTLTKAEDKLFSTIGGNGFPFIDIGGKYQFGVQYNPGLLAGMTHAQIADAMSDPTSPVGKAIIESANVLTAAICDVTGGQPANVCTSKGVAAGKKLLGAGSDLTKDQSTEGATPSAAG
jgi:hypothetical protein